MRPPTPTTQTVTAADAPDRWRDILDRVSRAATRVVVEDNGAAVAAVVSVDDLGRLTALDAERAEALAAFIAFGDYFKDVSDEEIEREVAKAIAEVRAENRQREPDQAGDRSA